MSILILINTSWFQNYLTDKIATWLSEEIEYPITIGNASIEWLDEIRIDSISILDRKDSTMIEVKSLVLDYRISDLVNQTTPSVEAIHIQAPKVLLIKHEQDEPINITSFIHVLNEKFKPKNKKIRTGDLLQIDYAKVNDGQFGYYDFTHDSITGQLDYYHFRIEQLDARVRNFRTDGINIELRIDSLSGYEPSRDEHIDHISGQFYYSRTKMELDEMDVYIGESHLTNYLAFEYDSVQAFSDFNHKVRIITEMDSTVISSKDLVMFAPTLNKIDEEWILSGKTRGTVSSLSTDTLTLQFGDGSKVRGKFNMDGLPNFYETFIDFNVIDGKVNANDLAVYFPPDARSSIRKFGTTYLDGNFIGFPLDFVSYGSFNSQLGYLRSDINLKLYGEEPTYTGKLVTRNFNLGAIMDQPDIVGKISMTGNVSGKSFTMDKMKMNLDAKISHIDLLDYSYKHIVTDALITKNQFEGNVDIKDKNLTMKASGLANFSNKEPIINLNTNIRHADLQKLFQLDLESVLSTRGTVNLQGKEIDNINGSSILNDFRLSYGNHHFAVDSVFMISTVDSAHRFFQLKSSIADVLMNGNFNFTSLISESGKLFKEYKLYFQNERDTIEQYYAQKQKEVNQNELYFKVEFNDVDSLISLYTQQPFHVDPNSYVTGNISILNNEISVDMESELKNLNYNGKQAETILIKAKTNKDPFSNHISSELKVNSDHQILLADNPTEDFYFNLDWLNERISFNSGISQKERNNTIATSGEVDFLKTSIEVSLDSAAVQIFDQYWEIDKKNIIHIGNQSVNFEHFTMVSDTQKIDLSGMVSLKPSDTLKLGLSNISLDILQAFTTTPLKGTLNGEVDFSNIYDKLKADGDIEVENFEFMESKLGDLKGKLHWINKDGSIYTDMNFIKDKEKLLNFKGRIMPFDDKKNLDLVAKIYPLELKTIEPIIDEYATDLKGIATGKIWVTGPFSQPLYNGHIYCENAGMKVNYLNTVYQFNDFIYLEDDMFSFKNVTIKDELGHKATVYGNVIHKNFSDYYFDLFGNFENFQVLNTTIEHNDLYYGTAYASGTYGVQGPMKDITIWTEAKTNKQTHLHIPLSSYEDIEQTDYIFFKKYALVPKEKKDTVDESASGIKLDFNMEITPDAYFELIFDLKAGDIIRGRGNGNLKLGLDTRGDFSLLGKYELTEGAYNFTIMNLVNKEFTIDNGSTIEWSGNPYEGAMDIHARYQQNASLKPIIDTTFNPQIFTQYPALKTKKFPVDVLLDLTGELLHPKIDLDVEVKKGYPLPAETSVAQFNSVMKHNEQELNRQVFSLMVLKQLASSNAGDNIDLGTSASNSISELLSNQLSYWMSQVDDKLEVEIDLASLDEEATNIWQLRLAYTFLDGRLRISRDGSFNNYNANNNNSASGILGEWTIEYLLSEDGKLRMKMYNKNNQNSLFSGLQNSTNTSAGASIMYTESFDHLKDLFKKKKSKNTETKKK